MILVDQASEAEVENLDLALRRDEEIGGLEVTMDQVVLESILQPERRLPNPVASEREREGITAADDAVERFPLDILHDDKQGVAALLGIKRRDQVRMSESRQGLDFRRQSL